MIRKDQADCMGCLSHCAFSSWAENEKNSTGRAIAQIRIQRRCRHRPVGRSREPHVRRHAAFRFRPPVHSTLRAVVKLFDRADGAGGAACSRSPLRRGFGQRAGQPRPIGRRSRAAGDEAHCPGRTSPRGFQARDCRRVLQSSTGARSRIRRRQAGCWYVLRDRRPRSSSRGAHATCAPSRPSCSLGYAPSRVCPIDPCARCAGRIRKRGLYRARRSLPTRTSTLNGDPPARYIVPLHRSGQSPNAKKKKSRPFAGVFTH